jgi:trimethylamine--corrinoid protein Co-methyltransferase
MPTASVIIGGDHTVFAPVYGPPFVRDIDGGRRYATIEDFRNFVKLAYMAPAMHHSGGTVCEPVDIPVSKRHLDMVYSHIRYSDKPFMGSVTAPERAEDSVAMAKMVFGDDFVDNNCVLINLINANSPMVFDDTMVGALKVYARAGQACVVSPFILAGAMSPVTIIGTLTQILAEASVGMAFAQLCRPGAPVVFGTFASSMSMQSGAPTFGTPEPAHVLFRRSPACPPPWRSVPVWWKRCAPPSYPMRRPRTKAPTRCFPVCLPVSTSCCTPQAGSKAGWSRATRSSSSTAISCQ